MPISPADVAAAAALARLRLEPGEATRMARELEGILVHVETLDAADAEAGPAPGGGGDVQALRADVPGADPLQVPAADMAPGWRDGFFTVPRVVARARQRSP